MIDIENLLSVARAVVDAADNTGCESPLIVTDENELERLRLAVDQAKKDLESGRVSLDPEHLSWEAVGPKDNPDLLQKSNISIAGVEHHVEAVAVCIQNGEQVSLLRPDDELPTWFDEHMEQDGTLQTVQIGSLPFDYVIRIIPHTE